MVGLLMTRHWPEREEYILDQFFIDHRFQRRGYGRRAMELLLEELERERLFPRVELCYHDEDEGARHLYETLGFRLTGERDEDEICMSRPLAGKPEE